MNCAAVIRRFDRHDGVVIDEVAHGELADVGLAADDRGTYRSDHTGGLELEVKLVGPERCHLETGAGDGGDWCGALQLLTVDVLHRPHHGVAVADEAETSVLVSVAVATRHASRSIRETDVCTSIFRLR
jgi:hypothetical protein